ncbi:MAG: hypothetical protein HY208_05020 [Nitrospirae bacterium]|nr:hypothetical protein [Nitrospirota bacterium]
MNKIKHFEEILRASDPLTSNSFRVLLEQVSQATSPNRIEEFFIRLNDELYAALWGRNGGKKSWAQEMVRVLLAVNEGVTITALKELMDNRELHYDDPLVQAVAGMAGQSTPLLAALLGVVQLECQLLGLRVRALEAIFVRQSKEEGDGVAIEAGNLLHFLNELLDSKKWTIGGMEGVHQELTDRFRPVRKLFSDIDARSWNAMANESGFLPGGCNGILDMALEALRRLAVNPRAPDTMLVVLNLLKLNAPLPAWYAAAAPLVARLNMHAEHDRTSRAVHQPCASEAAVPLGRHSGAPRRMIGEIEPDTHLMLTLVIDKAIKTALTVADTQWGGMLSQKVSEPARTAISLNPSDPALLESVLLDQGVPLKVRTTAAALLRIVSHALPLARLTPRLEFYTDLLLTPSLRPVREKPERRLNVSIIDAREKIPVLLDAFHEKSDAVRWMVSKICYAAAQERPEWFMPRHRIQLLPLLSDRHDRIRLNIARTFSSLSAHGDQGMAAAVHEIAKKLSMEVWQTEGEASAQRELSAALAAIFDDLCQQVENLQRRVQWLDAKRKSLLNSIENQALRIGEEIHHEILNTRCGYLATSIDEESYGEARRDLEELVADLRRIMSNLYPKDLEAEGFLSTIRKRLEDAKSLIRRRIPGFTAVFDCADGITDEQIANRLGRPEHLVLLYRIVLEAIINARKHAHGTSIGVIVYRPAPDGIDIAVSDDGGGNGGPYQEHVGLALMRLRAEEIGAVIEYRKTSPKGGTTVVIHLPQPHEETGS